MTIIEAINLTDAGTHNTVDQRTKVKWLSDLDHKVFSMMQGYEGSPEGAFEGYTEETDQDTALLIPAPYDDIYLMYLQMKVFLTIAEYTRYNNAALLYNEAWQRFANSYNRTHTAKECKVRYF